MISGQGLHRGGGDRVNRFVHSLGKLLREVADQERNIAVALAKWRDLDWENIQPEEQVGAEFLFGDHRFQIAVCGSNQSSIGAQRPRTAQADRKSTRLNSSHTVISYAVFCL